MELIRILLADASPLVRVGLRTILCKRAGMTVVGEAEDGERAVSLCRRLKPDVVLMDVRMPRMDGIQAISHIKGPAGVEGVKVIMFTMFDHDEYLFLALKLGASGFLGKDSAPDMIISAVRAAHSGDALLSPKTTARLISAFVDAPGMPTSTGVDLASLTPRERDVLELIVSGLHNDEIANYLGVSQATVKSHMRHLLEKLRCRDRVQLVIYGFEHGMRRRVMAS
jgi:DNA-binding NarL/FixJ family response regulator